MLYKLRALHSGCSERIPVSCLYYAQDKFLQKSVNLCSAVTSDLKEATSRPGVRATVTMAKQPISHGTDITYCASKATRPGSAKRTKPATCAKQIHLWQPTAHTATCAQSMDTKGQTSTTKQKQAGFRNILISRLLRI